MLMVVQYLLSTMHYKVGYNYTLVETVTASSKIMHIYEQLYIFLSLHL